MTACMQSAPFGEARYREPVSVNLNDGSSNARPTPIFVRAPLGTSCRAPTADASAAGRGYTLPLDSEVCWGMALVHGAGTWRPDASEHRPDLPSLQARIIAGILAWPVRIGKLLVCGYIQRDPLYEVVRVVGILDVPEPIARDGPSIVTGAHAHIWRQADGSQTQSVLDGVDVDA